MAGRKREPEAAPSKATVSWRPCHRIVPSRFPPIQLFERVADPADLEAIFAVEALTNTRLRTEVGELSLVALADRVSGPGSSWIMAPFTHVAGPGGRFSTAFFGAYYAARSVDTAIAETMYHRERFLRATQEAPIDLDMRVIEAWLQADVHDLRGAQATWSAAYDPVNYTASQQLATHWRAAGVDGVVYDSVRDDGGQCVAIFRPRCLRRARQTKQLCYRWDGTRISSVRELRELRDLSQRGS